MWNHDKDSDGKVLQKGDSVRFERSLYSHWGIYDGKGQIIHVIGEGSFGNSMPYSLVSGPEFSSVSSGVTTCRVKRETLQKVAAGDEFYVGNSLDGSHRHFSPDRIVNKALSYEGETWDYKLLKANCEHFVNKMRYDESKSLQIDNAIDVAVKVGVGAAVGVGALVLANTIFGTEEESQNQSRAGSRALEVAGAAGALAGLCSSSKGRGGAWSPQQQ